MSVLLVINEFIHSFTHAKNMECDEHLLHIMVRSWNKKETETKLVPTRSHSLQVEMCMQENHTNTLCQCYNIMGKVLADFSKVVLSEILSII